MWTQEKYQKAILFAAKAHGGQTIKGTNASYVVHISNVAMEVMGAWVENPDFDIDFALSVALLHDTLEDTDVTSEFLAKTFGDDICSSVMALTKDETLPYSRQMEDSLLRISENRFKETAIVKLADRITNLQHPPDLWDSPKRLAYRQSAILIMQKLAGANSYLQKRLQSKIDNYLKYCG